MEQVKVCHHTWKEHNHMQHVFSYQLGQVNLDTEDLPAPLTAHPEFEESEGYGLIVPSLVTAGTITR